MKIAQVTPVYPPHRGGTGQVAYEYTERLRQRGHAVHVFTPSYRPVEHDPPFVHRVPSPLHVGNAAFTPALYHRLTGFDLVHLHYPFFGGAEPTVLRKAIKGEHALVLSYYMDATAGGVKGLIFDAHRRVVLPWILSHADRILVSSLDYARTSALAHVKGALERVEAHPFGVDVDRFHPGTEPALRASLGIAPDAPVMLFVGGLDPAHHFKGFPVLVDALHGLHDLPWHLVVVGDGTLRARFEALVHSRSLGDRVRFAGNVSDDALPRYYRLADFHVFPSTARAEAFGLVALEAAATGIPTIASNLPGVRTVVLDRDTGLHVSPHDSSTLREAIRLLLAQHELRLRLGRRARERVESECSWDPLIDRLEQTYHAAVASHVMVSA